MAVKEYLVTLTNTIPDSQLVKLRKYDEAQGGGVEDVSEWVHVGNGQNQVALYTDLELGNAEYLLFRFESRPAGLVDSYKRSVIRLVDGYILHSLTDERIQESGRYEIPRPMCSGYVRVVSSVNGADIAGCKYSLHILVCTT